MDKESKNSIDSKIDEITEMRIFEGKIDFIENMPDNKININRFHRIPWDKELTHHKEISLNKYKEVMEKRLNSVPHSIKMLWAFFIGYFCIFSGLLISEIIMKQNSHQNVMDKKEAFKYANKQF